MLGVALAFNLLMLAVFFSLRAERGDCPPGWVGESCWEAQIGPAVAAEMWPWLWVGGDVILFLIWMAWLAGTSVGGGPPRPAASAAPAEPAPAPAPAVFVPCPTCGKQVNRQAGRCPYCQATVAGGS
jgi:endogenous inhibitor of DNA gyrase (YacG/DUF329 family)